ncbi:MAG TPA: hypothetical protein VHQ92_14115, partial [Pseudolabrys sp.]|nr:hypothetical protein [Pseudolabrys sp.]
MVLDQGLVVDIGRQAEPLADRFRDERFDFCCRYATNAARLFGLALHQSPRDVITVFGSSLPGVGWRHALTTIIEQPASEDGRGAPANLVMAASLRIQFGLNGVEQLAVNDRRLFTRKRLSLERHLSDVEPVAQQVPKRATRKWDTPNGLAGLQPAFLCDNASLAQVGHKQNQAAELEITAKDRPNRFGLSLIDRDLALSGVVAE